MNAHISSFISPSRASKNLMPDTFCLSQQLILEITTQLESHQKLKTFWMQSYNFRNIIIISETFIQSYKYGVHKKICQYPLKVNCTLTNTKHPVLITVRSQLKKSVASFLPCPVCALTKSANLCSSCQPTAVAALCCTVACTPCQSR